jgi:hypothetical protein
VRAEDLLAASVKLGATRDDVHELLERCGFTADAAHGTNA